MQPRTQVGSTTDNRISTTGSTGPCRSGLPSDRIRSQARSIHQGYATNVSHDAGHEHAVAVAVRWDDRSDASDVGAFLRRVSEPHDEDVGEAILRPRADGLERSFIRL